MANATMTSAGLWSKVADMGADLNPSVWITAAGVAVVIAIVGSKNLPFAWHMRVFYAIFQHTRRHRQQKGTAAALGPDALFQPVRTVSPTPLSDCDYNVHKSNSTFNADLDLARIHLFGALGFAALHGTGGPMPALSAVHCNFRKPVAPWERTQTYTRVLAWEDKWVYLASWIVKDDARAVQPAAWTLQPWRAGSAGGSGSRDGKARAPDVRAVSLARYVFKKGRKTVPPAEVLAMLGLLPNAAETDDSSKELAEKIETERVKGLQFVHGMAGLDGLIDVLSPAEGPALGEW